MVIVDQLAEAWSGFGHEVTIFTPLGTDDEEADAHLRYRVLRGQTTRALLREISQADLVVSMEVSLRAFIPSLLLAKRSLVTHQTWYYKELPGRRLNLHRQVQRFFAHRVAQVACSRPIGENWGGQFHCVGNPYRESVYAITDQVREYDFCFVGRVIYDKGPDLLIAALAEMRASGWSGKAAIVGEGDLVDELKEASERAGLADSVSFTGWLGGVELAQILNRSRVLVVPSRWEEPFGMVAVEGLACGCRVVVSSGGGFPEAAGELGYVFPNGDLKMLLAQMQLALQDGGYSAQELTELGVHLKKFEVNSVAKRYLSLGKDQ